MPLVRDRILSRLSEAVSSVLGGEAPPLDLQVPKVAAHGDYASNVALSLASQMKRPPREVASALVRALGENPGLLAAVEIAGPGFMNFRVAPEAWRGVVRGILDAGDAYGLQSFGRGARVQVEFVSANPTGPLHIGHGRGAATGDVLANLFSACGFEVQREYYINDAGNQMDTLGRSLWYRYQEILGEPVTFPENHYRGEYMLDLARAFLAEHGEKYRGGDLAQALPVFTRYAAGTIMAGIREDLDIFRVRFDEFFSERTLHERDLVAKTLSDLEARGFIYGQDGAKWFRSTAFGDEKDRVVVRANGVTTYFAADLAYHRDKFERGFDLVVDVWGADHHGYVARMQAGAQALGRKKDDLRLVLVQLVNLLRGGEPVTMSTRAGEFVTLREVIDEVGTDAARFIFLTRRSDSHLDFDLEVAKARSNDNPVFYVQYAHARLCSVFQVAREQGIEPDFAAPDVLAPLGNPEECALMKHLGEYPHVLSEAAKTLEPHRIPYYLNELVSLFHSYYHGNRIISEDAALTRARLALAQAVRVVIRNALAVLGVAAPEKM